MEKTSSVQMSANGTADNSRVVSKRSAAPTFRPAECMKGSGAPGTTPRRLRVAVEPSVPSNGVARTGGPGPIWETTREAQEAEAVMVRSLSPRQVLAAQMLAQGRRGIEVAKALNLSEETVSRWRHRPEFQALMREMLQETIDATRLGVLSLCAESIEHLRGLVRSFSDETSLKAITLVLGKVGPVLGVIGEEMRQPTANYRERVQPTGQD